MSPKQRSKKAKFANHIRFIKQWKRETEARRRLVAPPQRVWV